MSNFTILKSDNEKRLVFGWGSVALNAMGEQLVDHQGDMIDPDVLEETAYEYVLNFRDTGEEHIPSLRKKGKLVESVVFTLEKQAAMGIPAGILPVGWWVGFKIYDDRTWELIKSGHYKMFSIEGKAQRVPVEKKNEPPSFLNTVQKFNPFHDELGRFTHSNSARSFTYAPGKSKAHDLAISRQKEQHASTMPSSAQSKTLKSIESRTRNLKKEQFRVVDRDGNVVMQKQGDATSVTYSIGEAREHFSGNITIHNHPDGGTFSTADLSNFGHNCTEIRAAAPEGTYILRDMNHGTKWNDKTKTWYDMRQDLETAINDFKSNRQFRSEIRKKYQAEVQPIAERWAKRKDAGAPQDELNAIMSEYNEKWDKLKPQIEKDARKAYTDQYDSWYKNNAGYYGFEYVFNPVQSRTKKSFFLDLIGELGAIEKSSGDVVLDKDIADDIAEIVDSIIEEAKKELQEGKEKPVKKTISFLTMVEKFNPYHDRKGRFTQGSGFGVSSSLFSGDPDKQAVTFSANPDTKAGANAIARHGGVVPTAYGMEGGGGASGGGSDKPKEPSGTKKPKKPEKPKYKYDPVSNNKEAAAYLTESGIAGAASLNGVNKASIDNVNAMNETLTKLNAEYPIKTLNEVKVRSSTTGIAASAHYAGLYPRKQFMNDPEGFGDRVTNQYRINNQNQLTIWKERRRTLESNTDWNGDMRRKSADDMIKFYQDKLKYSRHNVVYKGKEVESVISHEYGHILADQKFRQINGRQKYSDGSTATRTREDVAKMTLVKTTLNKARETGDIYKISEYANKDAYEFFAESFAMKQLGEESLPKYIDDMITEVLK